MRDLAIENLVFGYESASAVIAGLSLRLLAARSEASPGGAVAHGPIVALLGESGCGKSTLLSILSGVHRKGDPGVNWVDGEVRFDGAPMPRALGPSELSVMFQQSLLLDGRTALENVLLPIELSRNGGDSRARAGELMSALQLDSVAGKRPRELSGGQRTRTCLARAVLPDPELLLLDEPFGSIDLLTRWEIYRTIIKPRRQPDRLTLIATHDLFEAAMLANTIVIIKRAEHGGLARTEIKIVENEPVPEQDHLLAMHEWLPGVGRKVERLVLETRFHDAMHGQ